MPAAAKTSNAIAQPADDAVDRAVDRLLSVIVPLRRALRRAGRRQFPLERLPSAQAELLRLVQQHPGIGVYQAAEELALAGNSVSTLVNQLVTAGLLKREQDPQDRRHAQLSITTKAARRLDLWSDRRFELMRAAFDVLSEDDRRHIDAAVPALQKVLAALEAQ